MEETPSGESLIKRLRVTLHPLLGRESGELCRILDGVTAIELGFLLPLDREPSNG